MKKLVVLSAIFALTATMFSCKKDYECRDSSGYVMSTCVDCGPASRDTHKVNCDLLGGTQYEVD